MSRLFKNMALATNWPLFLAVGVLSALGTLTIWADSSSEGLKQLIFIAIGTACMFAFQLIDYRQIGYYAILFYIGAAIFIFYTILGQAVFGATGMNLPGLRQVNGAWNWIFLGGFSLQPSELMKVGFVMVLARYLRFRSNYRTLGGLFPPFLLGAFPMLLILKQPDLGTALVFIPALFAMLFVAGARMKHLLGVVAMGMAMIPFVWLSGMDGVPVFKHTPSLIKKYQRDRVYAMFQDDPVMRENTGFQQRWALAALGSGGATGKGIGEVPVGSHVPEGHNDMVFALIGEQLGFFGSTIVILSYLVVFFVGIEIAGSTREPFGRLVAVGVVTMLAGQTFLNLLVVTKLFPVTGVTLPFISYGGSSLIASFMFVGLLINISQKRPLIMAKHVFEFQD